MKNPYIYRSLNTLPRITFTLIRHLCLLSLLFFQNHAFAQREYGVCDSTQYSLNTDSTIIAGRNHLYLHTNNSTSILYNFTSLNADEYIKDFDIIKPNLWYTVIGEKYIGSNGRLYKSINRGQTWTLDTSHYNASNAQNVSPSFLKSINYLQHLNGDTLIMFMHYYESGILYSTNGGTSWTKWFHNLSTHYQGMMECGNKYYIYGFAGDGFRSWMFGFNKQLLFSPDTSYKWSIIQTNSNHPKCNNNDTIRCIYSPFSVTSRCGMYQFYKKHIDSLCGLTSVNEMNIGGFEIFPNPTNGILMIKMNELTSSKMSNIEIHDLFGRLVFSNKSYNQPTIEINMKLVNAGIYFLTIIQETKRQTFKIIKE